jgi:hypothetical protein
LRYFDVTTLKYAEEPDLDIPEEYQVPVEAAFELAKAYTGEGRQDIDTGSEFTSDYIIAYNLANGYYEYGFFYVDRSEGGIDLEYISRQTRKLAELGETKIEEFSGETGTFLWFCSEGKQSEFEALASDSTYKGYTKGGIKFIHFVSADKRGKFAVRRNNKGDIPGAIGFLRYTLDKIAAEVLGLGEITEVTLVSNPGTGHAVVIYEIDGEYIYLGWFTSSYQYYVLGDFKSPDFKSTGFYQEHIKGFAFDLDTDINIGNWDNFINDGDD